MPDELEVGDRAPNFDCPLSMVIKPVSQVHRLKKR